MNDDIASLQIRVLTDQVDAANRRLATLEATGARTEKTLGSISRVSFTKVLGTLAALGVSVTALTRSATAATRQWLEYDKAVKEVNSITQQTRAEFTQMRRDVLDLSVALGVDATMAARGLYQAISAGVPRENAITFLATASKAAIAGVTDVNTAVDGLTNVINAFKIPVEQAEAVADKLFSAVVNGKTTFQELSNEMSKASVPAAALGVDLDELLGMVVAITKQGTGTAEAFTQVRAVLTALTNPSKELLDTYENLGIQSIRLAIEQNGLVNTLEQVRQAYDGQDAALVRALRRSEAYLGVLSTTGSNLAEVKSATDAAANSAGLMGDAYAENSNTLENALTSLRASAIGLVETMEGSLGVISKFTELLRDAAFAINELASSEGSWSRQGHRALEMFGDSPAAVLEMERNLGKMTQRLENLTEARDRMLARGVTAAPSAWHGFTDPASVQLHKTNEEIARLTNESDRLRSSLSNLSPQARQTAEAMNELADLEEKRQQGLISGSEFIRAHDEIHKRLEVQKTTLEIIAGGDERRARAAEELAEQQRRNREIAIAQAAEEAKALEEKDRRLASIAERAQDLATTARERLVYQLEQVQEAHKEGAITDDVASKAKANLREQIALIDERNEKASGGGSGGGSSVASALPTTGATFLPDLIDPFGTHSALDALRAQEDMIRESYERRKDAILEMTEVTEEERLALLADASQRYQDLMAKADEARREIALDHASGFFRDLATMASVFGRRGAEVAKAAAIAQATVDMYASANAAFKSLVGVPFVGPALATAAAGAALASGAANIQRIKATEYSGAYEHGGQIPSGKFGLVGEAGPELVKGPAVVTSARTTEGMMRGGSGSSVQVNIVNNTGAEVTEKRSKQDDREIIEFIIGQARDRVADDIKKGGTSVARAIEGTYKMGRGRR
jgi:TP901 family phage tail tape measure protein